MPLLLLLGAAACVKAGIPSFPPHLVGNTSAIAALLERVLPGSSKNFELDIAPTCPGIPHGTNCFTLADSGGGATTKIKITGTTAAEVTGGQRISN